MWTKIDRFRTDTSWLLFSEMCVSVTWFYGKNLWMKEHETRILFTSSERCREWWYSLYLKAEDEVERDVEGEEEHLQDVLQDVHLVDHARPLQGHAHLSQDQFLKWMLFFLSFYEKFMLLEVCFCKVNISKDYIIELYLNMKNTLTISKHSQLSISCQLVFFTNGWM